MVFHALQCRINVLLGKLINEPAVTEQYRAALLHLCKAHGSAKLGDYLEFGVFYGASLACMNRVLDDLEIDHIRQFGFDSFQGLPDDASFNDEGTWQPGQFKSDFESTKQRLSKQCPSPDRISLVKGWFNDTLNATTREQYEIEKASVIMIDCDLYSSAKQALRFCAPLIKDEAIVVFDDWNANKLAKKGMGEKRAFDEFLAENPHLSAKPFGSYSFVGNDNHGQVFSVSCA